VRPVRLLDKGRIEAHLREDPGLHVYGLADLDDRFWPKTEWHGVEAGQGLAAAAFIYHAPAGPTLLALGPERRAPALRGLLAGLDLPDRFYAHLSPGLRGALEGRFRLASRGLHLKMNLRDAGALAGADVSRAFPLGPGDRDELMRFYADSYPGNWFDPWMLETGRYFAVREGADDRGLSRGSAASEAGGAAIAAAAGVHAFSPAYKVAAVGNVATRPSHRGRGLGSCVTAAVCRSLLESVELIGLNVQADNAAAIRVYERLGFRRAAVYEEYEAVST